MGPSLVTPPAEPILDMLDIQGIAVPGFFKPHQTLLYLRVPEGRQTLLHFKAFLGTIADQVATAELTLRDRRQHRKAAPHGAEMDHRRASPVLVAVGISGQGLARITPGAYEIPSVAFKSGLVARSALLGDPTDATSEGHPSKWVVGPAGQELDAIVVVAGNHRGPVSARAKALADTLLSGGIDVACEDGDIRADDPGHEHFGFDDGVSQPGIRGMASGRANDFITNRYVRPTQTPAAWLYGYPGQDLVWPGEFVIGYPTSSPDPLVPGPPLVPLPDWTRNGSFLVFRRLRQDVGLFWNTMKDEAERLAKHPGFPHLDYRRLAALLVGRWPSGAPVNRVPARDVKRLGRNRFANNDFRFDSATPRLPLVDHHRDPFPSAKADPLGATCPWAAHIRKVNTRDSASDMGGRSSTYERRLLRVGVPFGPSLKDPFAEVAADPAHGNRGLLFLSIQASIEQQFEFLQARWINDDSRPKMPGGNDMLVGQNAAAAAGVRRCTLFGRALEQAEVRASGQWVIPTGGGYFLVPSITTLRGVLASP
jgi:Dyp-type peroxidase family